MNSIFSFSAEMSVRNEKFVAWTVTNTRYELVYIVSQIAIKVNSYTTDFPYVKRKISLFYKVIL